MAGKGAIPPWGEAATGRLIEIKRMNSLKCERYFEENSERSQTVSI